MKKILTLCFLGFLINFVTAQNNIPVMFFPFNANTLDESGNNNHATNYGASLTTDRFGNENSAYYFDGIDDYMEIIPVSDMSQIGDFTISLWMQFDSWTYPENPQESISNLQEAKYIFNGHATSAIETTDFYREGINIIATRDINNNEFINTGTVYTYSPITFYRTINEVTNLTEWKHIVYVRENGVFTTYINGEVATVSFTNGDIDLEKKLNMMHNIYLGTFCGNNPNIMYQGSYNYKGKLDEVRFYNVALCNNQIKTLYSGNTNLVMYYPFNGNTFDESGNTNQATNNGAILTTDRLGNENSAYYFDGVDDFMEIIPVSDVSQIADFTISLWMQFDSWGYPETPTESISNIEESKYIFNGHTRSSTESSDFYREGINIIAARDINNNEFINTGTVYTYSPITYYRTVNEITNFEEWKHIVYMRENGVFTTYINGEVATISFTNGDINAEKTLDMMHSIYLGTFSGNNSNVLYNGTYNYKGKLDEVRFYNVALCNNQIHLLYTEGQEPIQIIEEETLLSKIISNNRMVLYPNPTDGKITISQVSNISTISLYSEIGTKLLDFSQVNKTEKTIDISNYPSGIYFISVDGMQIQKVIKK